MGERDLLYRRLGEIDQKWRCIQDQDLPWWDKATLRDRLQGERHSIEAQLTRDTRTLAEKEADGQLTLLPEVNP